MSSHPFDYGNDCVTKVTTERMIVAAGLSKMETEILYLRMAHDWQYDEIAKYIGKTYYGRTDDNPLWEGSIRYKMEKSLEKLRKVALKMHLLE